MEDRLRTHPSQSPECARSFLTIWFSWSLLRVKSLAGGPPQDCIKKTSKIKKEARDWRLPIETGRSKPEDRSRSCLASAGLQHFDGFVQLVVLNFLGLFLLGRVGR